LNNDGPETRVSEARFGEWPSPISADLLVSGAVGISECCVSTVPARGGAEPSESIWWSESRPDEGGRTALMRFGDGSVEEVTPSDANVRTLVHEYGGGAWWVDDDVAFYVDYGDQRLYRLERGAAPEALTAEPEIPSSVRFADFRMVPGGRWLVAVQEVHDGTEVINRLVAVATDGSDTRVLWAGSDFVAAPRPSPDGTRLAWIAWDHPNMPWDSTRLLVASFDEGELGSVVAEFGNGGEAWAQPGWSDDGVLHACTDRDQWWNLVRLDGIGTGAETVEPVLVGSFEIATPAWVFGMQRWALTPQGPVAAVGLRNGDELVVGGRTVSMPDATVSSLQACADGVVYVGAGFGHEPQVVRLRIEGQRVRREVVWQPRPLPVEVGFLIEPEAITFPTGDGTVHAHGLFYAPTNPRAMAPDGERPPLLVLAHGGPTSQARRQLQLAVLYWTSRGIAVVDVDYRGSTGYGRSFRRALDGQWGIADVQDCVAAAEFLVNRGDVDGDRLMIRGGSAGGFTVLAALADHDVFAVGASRYGVADLAALAADTHKFESRYLDTLVGRWPEDEAIYRERAPINRVDRFSAPMIVLQGDEDPIVPPNQSEMIVAALEQRGIPVCYRLFSGEQHGFRRAENVVAALESELAFFGEILGFVPADDLPELDIRR
jgi:dipeptidyl aminopeptidase/acylaminoacyl peptidase